MAFIERHGEIVFRRNGPACQHCTLARVDDLDFLLFRHIYENPCPRVFNLKRLGMSIDYDVPCHLPVGVDESESSSSFFAFSQLLGTCVANDHASDPSASVLRFRCCPGDLVTKNAVVMFLNRKRDGEDTD